MLPASLQVEGRVVLQQQEGEPGELAADDDQGLGDAAALKTLIGRGEVLPGLGGGHGGGHGRIEQQAPERGTSYSHLSYSLLSNSKIRSFRVTPGVTPTQSAPPKAVSRGCLRRTERPAGARHPSDRQPCPRHVRGWRSRACGRTGRSTRIASGSRNQKAHREPSPTSRRLGHPSAILLRLWRSPVPSRSAARTGCSPDRCVAASVLLPS